MNQQAWLAGRLRMDKGCDWNRPLQVLGRRGRVQLAHTSSDFAALSRATARLWCNTRGPTAVGSRRLRAAAALIWLNSTNRTAYCLNSSMYHALVDCLIIVSLVYFQSLSQGIRLARARSLVQVHIINRRRNSLSITPSRSLSDMSGGGGTTLS
jgi:hypothetical protein